MNGELRCSGMVAPDEDETISAVAIELDKTCVALWGEGVEIVCEPDEAVVVEAAVDERSRR